MMIIVPVPSGFCDTPFLVVMVVVVVVVCQYSGEGV